MKTSYHMIWTAALLLGAGCQSRTSKQQEAAAADTLRTTSDTLPKPYATKSVTKRSDVIGWPAGKMPVALAGFSVSKFAEGLKNPRWIYVAPNGDIFVSEAATEGKSQNDVLVFRDQDGDGKPEIKKVFLSNLNKPFGMLIMNGHFYVGNTDGILMYPYETGQLEMKTPGKMILSLPAGGYNNHWTRNLMASKDGKKILVTVGSGSNVGENGIDNEKRRANILEINPDGSGEKVYASGLRNPQGMGYAPGTEVLWTSVNERDELGDNLVPDYLTSLKRGGFYGWPYSYWGQHVDTRVKEQKPELIKTALVPDVNLGSHTASLGLAFDEQGIMGDSKGGAFIGQHGSWNRSVLVGYQVAYVPFKNGKPAGKVKGFLTGFIADSAAAKVYGRPVGVAFDHKGHLLVADDAGNTIWCVMPKK